MILGIDTGNLYRKLILAIDAEDAEERYFLRNSAKFFHGVRLARNQELPTLFTPVK
jgi:hypothetical protein